MIRFAVYSTGFILYLNFAVLQMWRFIAALRNVPASIMLPVCAVIFFGWCQVLLRMGKYPVSSKPFRIFPKDWMFLGLSVLTSLIFWYLWVYPSLYRSMNVWGDEETHFVISAAFTEYIGKYLHLEFPVSAGPYCVRYPNTMYLWGQWFLNPFTKLVDTPLSQRISLLFPYLGTAAVSFLISLHLLRKSGLALLLTLAYVSSPLLLSYTADKYLDIGHPVLFSLSSYWIYQLILVRSEYAALMAALAVSVLFSVRDNSAPTTLLYSVVIFIFFSPWGGFAPKGLRSWKKSGFFFLTAFFPLFAYVAIKTGVNQGDVARLSINHIFSQNYRDFFSHLLLEIPLVTLLFLLPGALVFTGKKLEQEKTIGIGVLLLSCFGQLGIYSIFQPGWMPWSRNYLMFCGQIFVCALIAFAEIMRFGKKGIQVAAVVSVVIVFAFNLVFGSLELKSNRFFHENEFHYEYQTLFKELVKSNFIPRGSTVFTNFTDTTSLLYSAKQVGFPLEHYPRTMVGGLLVSFENFVQSATKGARYFLFHYRNPQSAMPILKNNYPVNHRPTESELEGFKILIDLPDPGSNQKIGMILLESSIN